MDGLNHTRPCDLAAWSDLQALAGTSGTAHLRELFEKNRGRGTLYGVEAAGLYLDYSKQRVDEDVMRALLALVDEAGLTSAIEALFGGARINETEDRAVLHTALRAGEVASVVLDGEDVMVDVRRVLYRMRETAEKIRSGEWTGYTGKPIRNVINIGIGGSHLGPEMVYQALHSYSETSIRVRFVSNIDAADFFEAVEYCDAAETLFIIASKSFTTDETLTNARTARDWCVSALGSEEAVARHFVAVSSSTELVQEFGIDPENMFEFWDWVGGRTSLCAAIGFALMVGLGKDKFGELLGGFREMDEHFRSAPPESNLPVLMAMLGIWNTNFLGMKSLAILPYAHSLSRFPAYLQQLEMESNGKHTDRGGCRGGVGYGSGDLGGARDEWAACVLSASASGDAGDSL